MKDDATVSAGDYLYLYDADTDESTSMPPDLGDDDVAAIRRRLARRHLALVTDDRGWRVVRKDMKDMKDITLGQLAELLAALPDADVWVRCRASSRGPKTVIRIAGVAYEHEGNFAEALQKAITTITKYRGGAHGQE